MKGIFKFVEESSKIFIKLFKNLYNFEMDNRNALFPFIEFDRKNSSAEIRFLEDLNFLEEKAKGKEKINCF